MTKKRFGIRDGLRALSERPERAWPAGAVHHGVRVLLLLALAWGVQLLFPAAPVPDFPVLEKGMVAEEDVIAQVGFPIYKSEEELARERAEAAAGVAPIFVYDPAAVDTMLARVDAFLERVDSAATGTDETRVRSQIRGVLGAYGFAVTRDAVEILRSPVQRAVLENSLRAAIRNELPAGIASTADLEETTASQLRLRRADTERFLARDSLWTAPRFYDRAADHLPADAGAELAELQRLVLIRFFEPSVHLDRAATEAARERARQAVPAVKGEVLKGEKIVGAHEQVRETEMERLRAYQQHLVELGRLDPDGGDWGRALGAFLYNLLVLLVAGLFLYYFRRDIYTDFRHLMMVAFLTATLVAASAIIAWTEAPVELIPIAFPALVIAVLWDGRVALSLSLILSVLVAGQAQFLGLSVLFTMVLAGVAAALSVRVVRRRAQTWVFVSIIAAAYVAAAVALGLLRAWTIMDVGLSAGWGAVNAVVSALVAMGTLPLFEAFTRITTDQRLLELSDLDHPLLQRLRREAPGTFAHTINVANLAEAAAQAVGANPLLARVGIYYHDIGKIPKPQYFIENQPEGRNPHDKLKPATSASIVRNHVLDGVRLAEEHNLPECIQAFITEHHGTQAISFFYERAREQDGDVEPNRADYTYPGPKPQSRETAIAMLADSVESAARVLKDATPERVRDLVKRIVAGKLEQGQLDDTPLTLREISLIEDEFTQVLTGMYHHRIDYPSTGEESEETEPTPVGTGSATRRG